MNQVVQDMREKLASPAQPKAAGEASKRKNPLLMKVLLLGCVVIVIIALKGTSGSPSSEASSPVHPDALSDLAAAFKGDYTRGQVDDALSRVMNRFGEPLSASNYARLGRVLIALRKDSHPVSEMEILDCMLTMDPAFKFVPASAMCATARQYGM